MTAAPRRNACPTIARPMETGDGLLARLPPTGRMTAAAIRVIADAAACHGNGIVEVTARGSLQVRGLKAGSVKAFATALATAGIVDARPAVLVSPLAGLDPRETADLRAVADAIRRGVDETRAASLAPKTSVIVDGGGGLHLDAIEADVRLSAHGPCAVALAVGGTADTARPLGTVAIERAAGAALTILRHLAGPGQEARGRDLDPSALAAALGAAPAPAGLPPRSPGEPLGTHHLRDGSCAVGVGLPFGQTDAARLTAFVDAATACGATAFAPAPVRAVNALHLAPSAVRPLSAAAEALGFVLAADDPRRSVAACPGAPACAAGLMPARMVAGDIARAATPILDGSVTLHVSGCAKGCAHPRTASLTLVGIGNGAGLIIGGAAGDSPAVTIAPAAVPDAVARFAAAVATARRPGEATAVTIRRLGPHSLAALYREPADA